MRLSMDIPANLCKTLSAHAHAGRQWPEIGFRDQSAGLLAQLLNINLKQRWPLSKERQLVERGQWFDECCRDFFRRYPQATCVELGAGLSTRFHRLSDTSDWPRFHWIDVDVPQITISKAQVLPHIDNYTLVGADVMTNDWLRISGWAEGKPLLIIMEGLAADLGGKATIQLIFRLLKQAGSAQELAIVLDWRVHPWTLFIKTLVSTLGIKNPQLDSSNSRCVSVFEQGGFEITNRKDLYGGRAIGLVINYKNKESSCPLLL
ncbi:MAG: hypothetical protein EOO52_09445 [Gammaproteobacteria bacterium]|nr:MAG: hypothetical protein EOO52_09445 [Gammaproteobacteria bacterium]